jgi:hypothetical protein
LISVEDRVRPSPALLVPLPPVLSRDSRCPGWLLRSWLRRRKRLREEPGGLVLAVLAAAAGRPAGGAGVEKLAEWVNSIGGGW